MSLVLRIFFIFSLIIHLIFRSVNLVTELLLCVNNFGIGEYESRDDTIFIEADRYRVAQLVTNLLSNALKFIKRHDGLVSISIERREDVVGGSGREVALVSVKINCVSLLVPTLRIPKNWVDSLRLPLFSARA